MAVALPLPDVPFARAEAAARMAAEVRLGLTARPRSLPSKYFYDDRGSQLFEAITQLPEYYQTRTEEAILAAAADEIVRRSRPCELVELGSGAGRKIRLLLAATERAGLSARLTFFDINQRSVADSVSRIRECCAGVEVRGLVGDFTEDLTLLGPGGGRLAILFAGTIGNLHPALVPGFLSGVAGQLEPGDTFLVGVDLVKDRARLEAAYNDAAGVTAEFNRNILRHVNRELGADFDVAGFEHVAVWDEASSWIEMRLRAARPCRVKVPAAWLDLRFAAGEEVRTELSCKYTCASFSALLPDTGFALEAWLTDPERLFSLALLRREDA